ncbi:MAG: peptidylprolyl isomerase, partial [Alphaproteobacteria bacterium]
VAAGATPDEVASQKALAQTISETVTDCKDMAKLDKELGSNLSGNLGNLKIRELPAELRPLVLALGLERASKPIATKGGLRVLMVCERKDPPSSLPSRAETRRKLKLQRQERRAQRLARRILRGLRHTAHVDKRL